MRGASSRMHWPSSPLLTNPTLRALVASLCLPTRRRGCSTCRSLMDLPEWIVGAACLWRLLRLTALSQFWGAARSPGDLSASPAGADPGADGGRALFRRRCGRAQPDLSRRVCGGGHHGGARPRYFSAAVAAIRRLSEGPHRRGDPGRSRVRGIRLPQSTCPSWSVPSCPRRWVRGDLRTRAHHADFRSHRADHSYPVTSPPARGTYPPAGGAVEREATPASSIEGR